LKTYGFRGNCAKEKKERPVRHDSFSTLMPWRALSQDQRIGYTLA
jgi:hypothetical protein